jgi:hypothetical protein
MTRSAFHVATIALAIFAVPTSGFGDIVHFEDFEGSGGYTTSILEFTDNSNDFFLRTNGTNISPNVNYSNVQGSFYFAAQDIDGEGASLPVFIDLQTIDITGFSDIQFSGLFAEDDSTTLGEHWDTDDYVRIYYSIDGGTYQNLMWFERGVGLTPPMIDTDFNGIGDGAMITDTFTTHSAMIAGNGSTLDIRIEFNLNGSDEDFAMDSFLFSTTAIPEPGMIGLMGLIMVGLLAKRRHSKPIC